MEESRTTHEGKPRLLAGLAPLVLAGLLGGLLLFALWTVARADLPGQEWPISSWRYEDGLPDIAASKDGDYLALLWSRGRSKTAGPAGYIYLDAVEVADGKWRFPERVYPRFATDSNAAREARGVFDPRDAHSTTLHMVWGQKTGTAFNEILYASCDVAGGSCSASSIVTRTVVSASNGPNQPDVAVDASGRRHVVWVTTDGKVQYRCSTNGISWGSTIQVAQPATATQPSVAYANNKVHFAWAQGSSNVFDSIGYRNRTFSSGCTGSFVDGAVFDDAEPYQARDPRIAAAGNTVYVVWDVRTDMQLGETNIYTYYLVYNRSTNGGGTWDRTPPNNPEYLDIRNASTIFTARLVNEDRPDYNYDYGKWLHPDVTLEVTGSNTIAHVVWGQTTFVGDVGGELEDSYFDIFYTSRTGSGAWAAATNVTAGTQPDPSIFSVMPSVAIDENGQVHIAYMKEKGSGWNSPEDWDVYYYGVLEGPPQGIYFLPAVLKKRP